MLTWKTTNSSWKLTTWKISPFSGPIFPIVSLLSSSTSTNKDLLRSNRPSHRILVLTMLYRVRISESQVKQIDSVAFFKHDIKPAWEDPQNSGGGEFQLKLVDPYPQEINNLWEALVFDLMSGDLDMSDKVRIF